METILNEIFRALSYLIIAGIVYFIWITANNKAKEGKYKTVLWKGFILCTGIALFTSFSLGNPTCIDPSHDVNWIACNGYANDGYKPTAEQRVANFAYYMTLLYIPVMIGALKKR